MRGKQKPSWWLVYLIWFSMTALLAWDYSVLRPEWLQKVAAVLIMLIFGSLVAWWLRANQTALSREDEENRMRHKLTGIGRDIPLTPTQIAYLRTMERYKRPW